MLEDTGDEVPAAAYKQKQVSRVKANGQPVERTQPRLWEAARFLHLHLPVFFLLLPPPLGKLTLNSNKVRVGEEKGPGQTEVGEVSGGPSALLGDRLDEAGAGGVEMLRTYLAARQATSEEKKQNKAPTSGNVPTEGGQQQQQQEEKRNRLWARGSQLPFVYGDVSASQLQTVAWERPLL